jgi:hypothetical protein
VAEGALNAHSSFPCPYTTILPFEQLDLLVEEVLRKLIAAVEPRKMSGKLQEGS